MSEPFIFFVSAGDPSPLPSGSPSVEGDVPLSVFLGGASIVQQALCCCHSFIIVFLSSTFAGVATVIPRLIAPYAFSCRVPWPGLAGVCLPFADVCSLVPLWLIVSLLVCVLWGRKHGSHQRGSSLHFFGAAKNTPRASLLCVSCGQTVVGRPFSHTFTCFLSDMKLRTLFCLTSSLQSVVFVYFSTVLPKCALCSFISHSLREGVFCFPCIVAQTDFGFPILL